LNAVGSCVSLALGLAAWLVPGALTGQTEAWDDPAWFLYALPALAVALFFVGAMFPIRAWRWGPLAMAGQALALVLSGNGALLPVGLILMALLSLPFALVSWLGSRLRPAPAAPPAAPGPASRGSR
jgi:hypothetical protein